MQSQSTTGANATSLTERLETLQGWLVIAYAASLSLPITIPWILLIAGVVVGILQLLLARKNNSFTFQLPPLTVPIAALTVVYFISGFCNGGAKEAFASVGVMRTFIVYFWAYYVIHGRPELKRKILPALLVLGAAGGIAAVVEHQFELHVSSFKYLQGTGFLSGPMAFAGVMQMFSLLALSLWMTGAYDELSKPFESKQVFIPLVLGNVLGLLFAFERSAWFGFSVAAMVVAALVSRQFFIKMFALGVVTAAIGWLALPAVQARMGAILRGEQEESSRQRVAVWISAAEQYASSPVSEIIGVGPRKFAPLPIEGPNKQVLDHAHSNYLQSLTTTGLVGLFVYLWLSLASLKLTWQNFTKTRLEDRLDRSISLGIFGGIISLMLAGIFEYNFGTGNVRLAQWFLLAMLSGRQSWIASVKRIDQSDSIERQA